MSDPYDDDAITPDVMRSHYAGLGIRRLTSQEESYVLYRTRGLNPVAAARAAGYNKPQVAVAKLAQSEDIRDAIAYFREMSRQEAIQAGAIEFTRNDATLLYLEAHAKSANATEEIKAVDSLVRLHGLAAPEKKELEITTRGQLELMDDDTLMKLAGKTFHLAPDQYQEVQDA
ncbi:hypothetical protein HNR62_000305 [Oceanisphaera litoralis]|uniref:hypothetical protein n=1 Tax=Oceanisphaera litoralis TaxID=225144 RepID=UPI00195D6352|nr:hypothetical protein [Oceanisphaera litoralis]MBM7454476.1 hypothetical protein [Oceanisphaera litoralis]